MKNIFFSIIILLLFFSCQKYFSIENNNERNIILMCKLGTDKKPEVLLHKTFTYSDLRYNTYKDFIIKDADIYLFEENELKEKLVYVEDSANFIEFYKTQNFIPIEGKTYQIKAIISNYEEVIAQTTIPYSTKINNLTYNINTKIESDTKDTIFEIIVFVNFIDPKNEKNYYSINANHSFISEDPIIETKDYDFVYNSIYANVEEHNHCIFTDDLIDGKEYKITLVFDIRKSNITENFPIVITLNSLSKDAYMFYKTLYFQSKNDENPLTEPIQIYSNIKNGTGIFAGYSSSVDTFYLTSNMLQ